VSEVIVYGISGSSNMRDAMRDLADKGGDYELIDVLLPFKAPECMAHNPFGHVPVFDHAGFTLYETQAILRHVDQTLSRPALQPTNACGAPPNQNLGTIDRYLFRSWSGAIGFERLIALSCFALPRP